MVFEEKKNIMRYFIHFLMKFFFLLNLFYVLFPSFMWLLFDEILRASPSFHFHSLDENLKKLSQVKDFNDYSLLFKLEGW